ncbi:MAG: hypothetical protein P4L10_09125 [Acidobacteriaceae bacterium]|nr:hypothetical protein [Acidobacteriaceae bacterium]
MATKPTVRLEQLAPNDRRAILLQVERILKHPLFRLSKRLPIFLQYIVNESLEQWSEEPPKERTVGVEVFRRKPDYDTNTDPIVRVTASELRKKLAQYYYEDGHNDEIRIELPPGSYLPKFRRSVATDASMAEAEHIALWPPETGQPDSEAHNEEHAALESPESRVNFAESSEKVTDEHSRALPHSTSETEPHHQHTDANGHRSSAFVIWRRVAAILCLLLFVIAGSFIARIWHMSFTLGDFWKRFAGNSEQVFIVMPGKDVPHNEANISVSLTLSMEDANIAARVASQLEKQEVHYRLISAPEVTFDELRSGPAVLVGALDNNWTMRFSKDIPFVFQVTADGHTGQIVETATNKTWSLDIYTPHAHITRDYGIVASYKNKLTGQPVILIAGISSQGTQAAGELLTSATLIKSIPAYLGNVNNFEVVIETEAIDGHAGPPQIVASKAW